jgi:TPR repeat protein
MSLLPRVRFGRDKETEALRRRVSVLQATLDQCAEFAGRWTLFRREVTIALAVAMLGLGFALGVYREEIGRSALRVTEAVGITRPAQGRSADPAYAAYQPAYAAYQNGDYEAALRLAGPPATAGDARAQSLLGLLHYRGHGVAQDNDEALRWLRPAAEHGDTAAQFYLGVMFSEGKGVPQDLAEGARWYRRAAEQGDAAAQYNLGLYYARGEAGELDNVNAYMWLNLAAARFAATDPRRSAAVASRDAVAKMMTPPQIAEAQRRARERSAR